jgi:hypothetical protein
MYIIEEIIKFYNKYKNKENIINIPNSEDSMELEDVLTCKHNFMPIDSTGEILACSKCGYVITKKRLKKKN